jgi:hypothetical protein
MFGPLIRGRIHSKEIIALEWCKIKFSRISSRKFPISRTLSSNGKESLIVFWQLCLTEKDR